MKIALYNSYFFLEHLDSNVLKKYEKVLTYNYETPSYRFCFFCSPEFPNIVKAFRKNKKNTRVDTISIVCDSERDAKDFLKHEPHIQVIIRKFNRLNKQKYMLI